MIPAELAAECRKKAAELREVFGGEKQARGIEWCLGYFELALGSGTGRLLTLTEAAAEGGYSVDHLGRLVRQGKIPTAGRPGAPRIALEHAPRKAGVAPRLLPHQVDRTQIVRSAIAEGA